MKWALGLAPSCGDQTLGEALLELGVDIEGRGTHPVLCALQPVGGISGPLSTRERKLHRARESPALMLIEKGANISASGCSGELCGGGQEAA